MTGIIILAAGSSSRMGTAKQALPYKNSTLLQHSITVAVNSTASAVVAVLGANADTILPSTQLAGVTAVINSNWQDGMGGSLRTGMAKLIEIQPLSSAVLIMLCDQPMVSTTLINRLFDIKETNSKSLVACGYKSTIGVPAVFGKKYFPALLSLKGDAGAKKILQQYVNDVTVVPFADGAIDIDTVDDFKRLQQ